MPQGSLLEPLFLMFINDLPSLALPGNTIALYADDCKSSRIVDPNEDLKLLRQDLENLENMEYAEWYGLKWKIMKIARRRNKQPFT